MTNENQGHVHHSRSTRDILSADKVLSTAGLQFGDVFLDAGCGDGFISITASFLVGEDGKVYAIDVYPESIELVKKDVQKNGINNLEAIVADLTHEIPLIDDAVDLCVMANVLHGFVENDKLDEVLTEIKRVIKLGGIFSVVEFKKIKGLPGPPFDVRLNSQDVEDLLLKYGFTVTETIEVGKYHYMVTARKNP
ncbi:MAG: class I SAM-dependent methyltransferase [Methanobacterium sp.]|jgi:ubiquinone/menaquinone biosynthesis C-methylase UbiE